MAQNTAPVFLKAAVGDVAQVSAANAGRDGTGTIVTVATGTADGKRINVVRIKAIVTTTAGMIRLYYSADSGVTNRLIGEVLVAAITASATAAAFEADWIPPGGYLNLVGTTDMLRASTEKAEAHNLLALGGSYAA
jgi:hypothetical protein